MCLSHGSTVLCIWQVLRDIMKLGPRALLNVTDVYTMCVNSALIPISPHHTLVLIRTALLHSMTKVKVEKGKGCQFV